MRKSAGRALGIDDVATLDHLVVRNVIGCVRPTQMLNLVNYAFFLGDGKDLRMLAIRIPGFPFGKDGR